MPQPSDLVIELLQPDGYAPPIDRQLCLHPMDYALLQQAAASQKQTLADFMVLAAYLHARDVLAETQARTATAAVLCQTIHPFE